ncbi:hypothetical protein TI05_05790 [Achromatium sp. WMS3]|nr:hypothetical protein TI05_05790 [Achromatium sp. WMS3]
MFTLREEVFNKALQLSPLDQADLIENLLANFEFSSRKTIDDLWSADAENRIDAFERGAITSISAR